MDLTLSHQDTLDLASAAQKAVAAYVKQMVPKDKKVAVVGIANAEGQQLVGAVRLGDDFELQGSIRHATGQQGVDWQITGVWTAD